MKRITILLDTMFGELEMTLEKEAPFWEGASGFAAYPFDPRTKVPKELEEKYSVSEYHLHKDMKWLLCICNDAFYTIPPIKVIKVITPEHKNPE